MPDQMVLHKCDNTACCNPDHLYEGTHQDNMRDVRERGKGRGPSRRKILLTSAIFIFCIFLFVGSANAQDTCPVGFVCLPQATANRLLATVEQLIAAKDALAKLSAERAASDAVIASATRVIEDYKQLDIINGMMIVKYKMVVDLYEKTLTVYADLVDKMQKKIDAPKSAWQKFVGVLKTIATVAAGILIGRAGI